MSYRKWFIAISIFFAGAILGKPMALGAVGLFAKAFLLFEYGWHFSYASIDWQEGKLIFREIDLKESALSLHGKRVSIWLGARHVEIEQPTLLVSGMPRWKQSGGDWTIEMKNGTISGNEVGEFQFSFEKTWRHHLGCLVLERGESRMAIEAIKEDNEIWIDADLRHFQAEPFNHWIDWKGIADGRIHLVFDGSECKRGSLHLEFQEAGYSKVLSEAVGTLDWEGEAGADFLSNSLKNARVRLHLANGIVHGEEGAVQEIQGDFSFTAGVGAKWEFKAEAALNGRTIPMVWNGKVFLNDEQPHWLESEGICGNANLILNGEHGEEGFHWTGEGRGISPIEGTLIQSFWALVDRRLEPLEFEKGILDIHGEGLLQKDWNVAINAENLSCRFDKTSFQCLHAEIDWTSEQNGEFQFDGALGQVALAEDQTISIEAVKGNGKIEHGVLVRSQIEGKIDRIQGAVEATGTLDGFYLKAHGDQCQISLQGAWKERLEFDIEQGDYGGLFFAGAGWVSDEGCYSLHIDRFEGPLLPLSRTLGWSREIEGRIQSIGAGFFAEGSFPACDWFLQARGSLSSGLGFYCPILEKKNQLISFDVRIETPLWDFVRLVGASVGGTCTFDADRTHLMGMPLLIDSCVFDDKGLESMHLKAPMAWRSFIAAAPLWFPETTQWVSAPLDGTAVLDLAFIRNGGSAIQVEGQDLTWKGDPCFFHCLAHEEGGVWNISALQIDQCTMSLGVQIEGQTLHLSNGHATWNMGMESDFYGSIDSSLQFELHMPHLRLDLSHIDPIAQTVGIPLPGLQGITKGKGMISRHSQLEANFDFTVSDLKASTIELQNAGPLHLRYTTDAGMICSGLDLSAAGPKLPFFSCKIGLLQYDALRSLWILNHSHLHLPPRFLDFFPDCPTCLTQLNPKEELDFIADIECPSDFSSLSCCIKEVSIPFDGATIPVRNGCFSLNQTDLHTRFELDYQGYPLTLSLQALLGQDLSGRLILQDRDTSLQPSDRPLSIDWSYSKETGWLIREAEGEFGGVDASFHALDAGTSLIGSARIDFERLGQIVPARIAEVFTDLKMGKGYELKGKLFLENGISFRGLFTGKQIDLFGFQLRTLLSQFELDPGKLRLYDLKISDSAGMMKIDELVAEVQGDAPWTISIPHLTILELRPSLLQKPGREPEPAGPLVVRELKIDDLKGLLEESSTYTAHGTLSFINSFRREHTVFDIPSDLLGRIVGLDLELLIPACGDLQYELNNGFFHLTSLSDSFSEAQRSKFFLSDDFVSTMDLDGNLHISVSMKQFVLFKLTESFQILIDGKLDDPQYHLQKKRRFLGL